MLVEIDDVVQITTINREIMQLKVVGYYQSGIRELDNVQSFTSLSTAQKLMGKNTNYITDLQIKLNNIILAPQLAKEYSQLYEVDAVV
jgi:lipoprotein-releasing system permease protein